MPLPTDLPIVDHHCHLSPNGEGVAAARRFAAAGGTHLFLATQNYVAGVPRTLEAYRTQFETTGRLAEQVRRETGVEVYVVVAPYPVDLVAAAAELGVGPTLDLHRQALDLAGGLVRRQQAVALGEVGFPHFEVPPEIREAADCAFDHALAVAHDADCPVVVHSDELAAEGYADLARRAARAGVPAHRIVKHYARTRASAEDRAGVVASYLARRELVREVLADPGPWFLETDFLDDPRRPGAVLDLTTVPKRARALAETRPDGAELLRGPFVESVRTVYGWEPKRLERGGA